MTRNYQILNGDNIDRPEADMGRKAERHLKNDDFFSVISGKPMFTIGGSPVGPVTRNESSSDPTEISSGIENGETHTVEEGAGIHIPAGVWHQWRTEGTVQMRVWKIPAAGGQIEPSL